MATYIFRVRTPDRTDHRIEQHDFPDLPAALVGAQRAARLLVRNPVRRGRTAIAGSLDVENDGHQPVARLMLAEIAHQIS
jgi:hypothetical protein